MKRVGLGVTAVLATMLAAAPASAQMMSQPSGALTLTPAEQIALAPIKQAVDVRNWAGASSLIPGARSAARSADARYVLARLELEIANGTANAPAQMQAIARVLDSGKVTPAERVTLLLQSAGIAYDTGALNQAGALLNRAQEAAPNDPEVLSMAAQLNRNRNNPDQALGLFQRAVRAAEAAGRPLPESRYRVALAMAEQAGQRGVALEIARQMLSAYPTAINWRDAITVFRTVGTADPSQDLDALRLLRAAGGLSGERDYLRMAQALDTAGFQAEAKSVLEEGVSRRMVAAGDAAPRALLASVGPKITRDRSGLARRVTAARAATATALATREVADSLLAHGRYAEAAELYRLGLTRVGEDPGLLNLRLGIALAMAGQNAEAETAFRAVTGPRAELAGLWSTWLARRGA